MFTTITALRVFFEYCKVSESGISRRIYMSLCLPACSLKKQKLGEQLKNHFDAVNRTKKFFSQQITFVTKCEKIEFCFKGKRLIKKYTSNTETDSKSSLWGRRGARASPAKATTSLGIKNNTLLLGPHLSTPGRILILLGIPAKY